MNEATVVKVYKYGPLPFQGAQCPFMKEYTLDYVGNLKVVTGICLMYGVSGSLGYSAGS